MRSILNQTRLPEQIVICDDSDMGIRPLNRSVAATSNLGKGKVQYIENQRTNGASGCWNSAIDFIVREISNTSNVVLAFLDDDDSWSPEYLETCTDAMINQQLDMVAAGIQRIEGANLAPVFFSAPEKLEPDLFLVGNPGIQGSNLFLKLDLILKAGGFDESLSSATDRDLCIRIADLRDIRYSAIPDLLVQHYAESSRPRLSIKGSDAKLSGLTSFWQKYSGRMTQEQRLNFTTRAKELFDWKAPQSTLLGKIESATPSLMTAPEHQPFELIVGIISSEPDVLLPLLQSLAHLKACSSIASLKVLLLDNYCPKASLESVARQLQSKNMDLVVIPPSRFEADVQSGLFGNYLKITQGTQQSIAVSRTMIQRYLGLEMNKNPGAIGWLLDDDMRIDARALQYLPWLPTFKDNGVDVLLGAYEGASPNPPLNGLRVQLMDLIHNLQWLNKLPKNIALPNRKTENANTREQFSDYYYDLSRKHSAHLEKPMWLEPVYDHETAAEARARLVAGATGILNGDPLTRGIVARPCKNPIIEATNSVNRGGCTFVLNPDALKLTPNTILQIDGRHARRSDMIWAVVNRHYRDMNIKAVSFPVQHIGRINVTPSVNADKVLAEIVGSTLYAGLTDALQDHPNHRLKFTDLEIEQISELSTASMNHRLELLKTSLMRIQGLAETLDHIDTANEFSELRQHLKDDFRPGSILTITSLAKKLTKADIQSFLTQLTLEADDYAAASNLQITNIQ